MSTHDWTGKPVTILGLSRSGSAVARYLQKRGAQCFLSETAPASPTNEPLRTELENLGVEIEMGGHTQRCFTHSDLIIVSPGIPPHNAIMEQLRLSGKEIISEVELAYRETEVPMIGITGTNGKSTTTTLISKILGQAGHQAPACGNIGWPITSVIDQYSSGHVRADYLVAELSSFQLEFSPTLKTKISVFTNFKPDHLDWHGSVDAYEKAKLRLFTGEQSPEWCVLNANDAVARKIGEQTQGNVLWFAVDPATVADYENKVYLNSQDQIVLEVQGRQMTLFSVKDLVIIGSHNHENVMASVAVAHLLGVEPAIMTQACVEFQGLEHRLEYVDTIRGVRFYNDSKATNPDASLSALRAFPEQPVVLIAGGYDKMGPLEEFVEAVKANAFHVVLLGQARDRFAAALRQGGFDALSDASDLPSAIEKSLQVANGAPVLFSPACSSFDMFRNFEERGKVFKEAVHQLKRKHQSAVEA